MTSEIYLLNITVFNITSFTSPLPVLEVIHIIWMSYLFEIIKEMTWQWKATSEWEKLCRWRYMALLPVFILKELENLFSHSYPILYCDCTLQENISSPSEKFIHQLCYVVKQIGRMQFLSGKGNSRSTDKLLEVRDWDFPFFLILFLGKNLHSLYCHQEETIKEMCSNNCMLFHIQLP